MGNSRTITMAGPEPFPANTMVKCPHGHVIPKLTQFNQRHIKCCGGDCYDDTVGNKHGTGYSLSECTKVSARERVDQIMDDRCNGGLGMYRSMALDIDFLVTALEREWRKKNDGTD